MPDINLKSIPDEKNENDGFEVHNIDEDTRQEVKAESPSSKITIKFGKFVELVAKHSFIDVVEKNADLDIIIDANLLADLANSDEDKENVYNKWILVGFGLICGILITIFIIK